MAKQLADKVALVTGGSSGIGRAAAVAMGAAGAAVVVAARRAAEGEETAQQVVDAGGKACFIRADISRADQVEALVTQTVERYGRLDCAFNNAGVFVGGPVHEMSEEEFDLVMDANLKGVWLCMREALKIMSPAGAGHLPRLSHTPDHQHPPPQPCARSGR